MELIDDDQSCKLNVVDVARIRMRRRTREPEVAPVDVSTQVSRLRYIAQFLEFISGYIGADLPSAQRKGLASESEQALNAFRSLFRFFRFKSSSGETVRPTARIVRRALEVPDDGVRQALQLGARSKAIHLSRLRLADGQAVVAEEIWLPRDGFEALTTLALDDFGDLLYPLYERRRKQVVATARETLRVEVAQKTIAATLGIAPAQSVIRVNRIAFNFAGKPVECRSTAGATDGFQYEIEIR